MNDENKTTTDNEGQAATTTREPFIQTQKDGSIRVGKFKLTVAFALAFVIGSATTMYFEMIKVQALTGLALKRISDAENQIAMLTAGNSALKAVIANEPNFSLATQAQANESLGFLNGVMPNTKFESATVAKGTPGLIEVQTSNAGLPAYFDPIRKYLIMGLVVDFSKDAMAHPAQSIAGGTQK